MTQPIHSSFWLSDSPLYQHFRSTPTPPSSANVVIIGGGFSGVSVAYWLRQNGIENIVILEQRGISNGATGRNGGHCWPCPHIPNDKWVAKYGKDEINRIRKFDLENLHLIRQFLESDPQFSELVEFHMTGGVDAVPKSRTEVNANEKMMRYDYDTLTATNIIEDKNIIWWDEEMCKKEMGEDTQFCCGIVQERASQLWPAKLVFAILQRTLDLGSVQVYTQTKVVREQKREGEEGYVVEFDMEAQAPEGKAEKGEIKCKNVVYAVNAWIPTLLPEYKEIVTPVRGQVLVTTPVNQPLVASGLSVGLGFEISDHSGKALKKGRVEEEEDSDEEDEEEEEENNVEDDGDDDLFYVIQRKKDKRVVVGTRVPRKRGATEEELYNDKEPYPDVTKELEDFLETFPAMKRKEDGSREWKGEFVWQGVMGFTDDDFPLVGPLGEGKQQGGEGKEEGKQEGEGKRGERENGRYILGGFNGDGMPKCFGSGKAIAEMIVGKLQPQDFLPSFSPRRFVRECD